MANTPSNGNPPAAASPRGVRSAVVIGSALEWFDFYLYASMAALVFGKIFFPTGNETVATLASLGTFAVGFLARPLGGVVFGIMGDRIGRKKVLALTFTLMGVSSACIGLLPTYSSVGLAAPLLLVFFRLLQGLGAGAEFGSAITVAYEHAAPGSRGRQGSWPALGVNLGLLASSLVVAALTSTSKGFLYDFGWRIPFLMSFALVGIGLWVRRRMPETPEFEQLATEKEAPHAPRRHPFTTLLRSNWRGLAVVMAITIGYNGVSYIFKTFSLAYLTDFRDVPASVGALGISIASCVAIACIPVIGRITDRYGPQRLVLAGAVATGLLAFPFFWLLDTGTSWLIWLALTLATGLVVPTMLAAQGAFLARQFPADVRASGLGTGREVGGALSGGLAPLAAFATVQASPGHATWGVSLLFVAGALLVGVGALFDRSRHEGAEDPEQDGGTADAPAPARVG
ncbi:MFS transporter [Streptomyces sulphureus]|uniref:MFS transporter n=1 Tax=Streptomyces sulphureus TaxID=47758 RepID=UPI0003675910|nr:MFS transporter [Streptomyces sulphureus]